MIKIENPTNGRFYNFYTQFDLFNNPVLIILSGGNRIRNSRIVRNIGANGERHIQMEIKRLIELCKKNGFVEVG